MNLRYDLARRYINVASRMKFTETRKLRVSVNKSAFGYKKRLERYSGYLFQIATMLNSDYPCDSIIAWIDENIEFFEKNRACDAIFLKKLRSRIASVREFEDTHV